jgi:toxin ParE1/3/4
VRQVRLLDGARDDIANIGDYIEIASGSAGTAERFVRQLNEQCRQLGRLPGTLGRARPELLPDIRSFPFKGYMIFFRYLGDVVEIVRIIEGHRDIGTVFRKDQQ